MSLSSLQYYPRSVVLDERGGETYYEVKLLLAPQPALAGQLVSPQLSSPLRHQLSLTRPELCFAGDAPDLLFNLIYCQIDKTAGP